MSRWRIAGLTLAFVAVHAILIAENLLAPNGPLGDVQWTYPEWWAEAVTSGRYPGLSATGVYPVLSLIPIAVSSFGEWAWFSLVVALDAIAVIVLARRSVLAASVWLVFQLALGPIALGRIDALTVALAVIAVALVESSPRIAGVMVALATWVKVWPFALGIAALRIPRFRTFAVWAMGVAVAVAGIAVLIGDRVSVMSFLVQQQGRGLQVESVAATPWLWDAWARGGSVIEYSAGIHTFEVTGTGTDTVAGLLTVVQVLFLAAIALVALAHRRSVGPTAGASFGYILLVLVALLIVANKVGSPQFVSWFAVPLVALVLVSGPRFPTGLVAMMGSIAVLTHLVYPYEYFALLELRTPPLMLLTARNLLEVVLLVWSAIALMVQLRVEKLAKQFTDLGIGNQESVVAEGR